VGNDGKGAAAPDFGGQGRGRQEELRALSVRTAGGKASILPSLR
jgi:hypothetical protein